MSIPTTVGRREEYVCQILKRVLPPAKYAVANKDLDQVSDLLNCIVKRFRPSYDFTHYLDQTRKLVKFAGEPLECFLDRLAALIEYGMRSVEDKPEETQEILKGLLDKEALTRFKEYASPALKDSIRRAKAKKIEDVTKLLDSEEHQSTAALPTP